jgi:predicted DNA-binding protein (MmcQ/YjbR family)
LKLTGDGNIDIMNVKTSDAEFFRGVKGVLPAYHMNKNHWITILLDGTLPIKNVQNLIKMSYELTL